MRSRRPPALGLALAALCALAGCGLGPGATPKGTRLTITRNFGARMLEGSPSKSPRLEGQETVMSMLRRNTTVSTRYSGGFVQSIDGLAGGTKHGVPYDWFYYVNGVQAQKGAAETNVHAGNRVWWDLHNWSQTEDIPAVVGSFPEPFLTGVEGKRLPVRVECAEPSASACRTVLERLRARGVPAALAAISGGEGRFTLRVLVGPFSTLHGDPGVQSIGRGPRYSGVYASFSGDGSRLALLDAAGRTTRTLGAHAGLVAATRYRNDAPVWVVTGTDTAGVGLAADAFQESSLRDRFALALQAQGTAVALPDER